MLSHRKYPNLNRRLRRGIPAAFRKGARNPVTEADVIVQEMRQYHPEWSPYA